jgi:hypothetical protein
MIEKLDAEIPYSEYRLRNEWAKELMKKHGLDARQRCDINFTSLWS